MKTTKKILIFAFAIFFVSCEKENDASEVAILLKSGVVTQHAAAGNKIAYNIEAYSLHSTLKEFSIKSFDGEYGEIVLFETKPDEAKFSYNFVYNVPAFSKDSVPVVLTMRAIDYNNNSFNLKCHVIVTGGAQLLQEMSGIVMYSGLSGNADAFSLQNPSQVFLRSLADSAMIDVYAYEGENPETTTLFREWRTNTNVLFAKVNSFAYSTATLVSVKNSFNASVKDKFVKNLQPNDIILFGQQDKNIFGAIQITEIVDNTGTNNDYYRFSIKMVK